MAGAGSFQVTGLSSGLDTNSIIEQMLALQRKPIEALQLRQSVMKQRLGATEGIKSKLGTLLSKISPLLLQTTVQARATTVSQTSAFTASAGSAAAFGSHQITINKIATTSNVQSTNAIGAAIDVGSALSTAGFSGTPTSGTFSINGTSITIDASVDSLTNIVARIDTDLAGRVDAEIVNDADGRPNMVRLTSLDGQSVQVGSHGDTSNFLNITRLSAAPSGLTVTSTSGIGVTQPNAKLQDARLSAALAGTGSFTINGVSISYDASVDSLNSVISRINTSDAKVTASYDSVADKVVLRAKQTGSLSISMQDTTGNFLQSVGVLGASQTLGQNAEYSIDTVAGGAVQTSTSNTLTNVIPGVTLNLMTETTGAATLTVSQDTGTAVKAIKEFVDQFNSILDELAKQTGYSDETKVAGILNGDSLIRGVSTKMRQIVSDQGEGLTGVYQALSEIGISFGKIGSEVGTTRKLVVDESKLTQALQSRPEDVQAVLGASTATSTGVLIRLRDYLNTTTAPGGLFSNLKTSVDRQTKQMTARIEQMETRLEARRESLVRKFAAMEGLLAQLQAQSSQLGNQLQALQK